MTYTISGKEVGPIGYGMLGLTMRRGGPVPDEQAFAAMKEALNNGCNYWNGGEFYGTETDNSLTVLTKYFDKYPEDASKIVFNLKGSVRPFLQIDGNPSYVKECIERSMSILGDKLFIHQYESARKDAKVPYADTIGAIDEFVKAGKIGGVALSEVNANTIRKAANIVEIKAVEVELSLWETAPLTNGIVEACAELKIPILAYSPLGRGFLTGAYKSLSDIPEGDFRHMVPRFQGENFNKNLELVKKTQEMAERKGCTPSQLAINWVVALSKKPGMPVIIPIPGASAADRVRENSKLVEITEGEMAEIDEMLKTFDIVGDRYPEHAMEQLDQDTT